MTDLVHNLDAERNMLAAVLDDPAQADRLLEVVTSDDLYQPAHAELWSVIGDMRRNSEPTDPARVMSELYRLSLVGKHGSLVADLTTRTVAVGTQAGYYAALVVDAARRREIQQLAQRLEDRAGRPDADPDGLLDDLDADALRLRRARINPNVMPPTMGDLAGRDNMKSWVVPGMVADHDRVIAVAHEGHGKSLMLFQTAAATAAGLHPFTLDPIPPQRVLVVDCENDPDAVSERADSLLGACFRHSADPGDLLRYVERPEGLELTNPTDSAWLSRIVTQVQPKLLAIGPLYRLTEQDLAKEEPSRAVMASLDRARLRGGCALLMEAHVGNETQSGHRPFRPYGSSGWRRWAGIGLSLKPAAGFPLSEHIYKVTDYRGRRSQRDWPEFLTWGSSDGFPWRAMSSMEVNARKDYAMGSGTWQAAS